MRCLQYLHESWTLFPFYRNKLVCAGKPRRYVFLQCMQLVLTEKRRRKSRVILPGVSWWHLLDMLRAVWPNAFAPGSFTLRTLFSRRLHPELAAGKFGIPVPNLQASNSDTYRLFYLQTKVAADLCNDGSSGCDANKYCVCRVSEMWEPLYCLPTSTGIHMLRMRRDIIQMLKCNGTNSSSHALQKAVSVMQTRRSANDAATCRFLFDITCTIHLGHQGAL